MPDTTEKRWYEFISLSLLLGLAAAITLVVLVYAAYSFRRVEKTFADII